MLLRKCPQTNIFFISIDVYFCGGNIKGIGIFSSELLHWRKLLQIPLMLIYIHAKWFSVNTTILIMTSIILTLNIKNAQYICHIVLVMNGNGYKLNNQFAMLKTKWLFLSLLWLRVLDFIMAWHGMALLPNNIWSTTMTEVEYRWDLKLTKGPQRWGMGMSVVSILGKNEHLLTPLPPDKMATISQIIFSDAFLWMKSFVFWLKCQWSLFLRVEMTITQHWLR